VDLAGRLGCQTGSGGFDICEALEFSFFVSTVLRCSLGGSNSLDGFRIVYGLRCSLRFPVR
jgi:hypothetical protein